MEWENILSRFIPGSEISQLNQEMERWAPVSNVLWDTLQCARDAFLMSGGLVDASMLDAIQKFGYLQNFETMNSNNLVRSALVNNRKKHVFSDIQFNDSRQEVFLPSGCAIDLGGVAKGWAAQQTMLRLSQFAPALVNAGGDIAISGLQTNGEPWTIGITDPANPEQSIQILSVKNGGVATSGKDYHRWQRNGDWVHHLIDPRTHKPAQTDILTATILAPSVMEAEMAAKTTFILGRHKAMKWLDVHPEFTGYLILDDKTIISNEKIQIAI